MSNDLSTLSGISKARNDLYAKTISGEVPEQRANVLDRILRGQTYLEGDLRLKYLSMLGRYGLLDGDKVPAQGSASHAIQGLQRFLGGAVDVTPQTI